jgi:hypothetical protein
MKKFPNLIGIYSKQKNISKDGFIKPTENS